MPQHEDNGLLDSLAQAAGYDDYAAFIAHLPETPAKRYAAVHAAYVMN